MNRGRRLRGARDLIWVVVVAAIGAATFELTSPPDWLQAIVLMPLAIGLPGYAITAALFRPGAVSPGDRLVLSFVLTIGASAIGCLVLQLAFDLDRDDWLWLMFGTTVIAAAVAAARRRPRLATATSKAELRALSRRIPALVTPTLLFAIAIAIAGYAIAIASQGVADQDARQSYASLWAVPARGPAGELEVGVWNHRGPEQLRLELRREGTARANLHLRLGPTERWSDRLDTPLLEGAGPLRVILYAQGEEYRSLEIYPEPAE